MRARTVIMGSLVALALSGCAGQGNAATTPITTQTYGGNFLPFDVRLLQQPQHTTDDCGRSLLAPCDKGGAR